jgi:hypothetical protein
MRMCSQGVVYTQNRTGHRMFDKEKATRRIDGMVSLAMSIGVATAARIIGFEPVMPWDVEVYRVQQPQRLPVRLWDSSFASAAEG